jgi:3-hydroxyisobutyrate dehydrogenase-like beta-hydroxyacid dehydrogenase
MRIAFCGMGRMGAPMAARLIDAGHDLTVWNRTKEKAEPLGERGARVAGTPREAAENSEVAVTMLADPDAVRDVVLGTDGLGSGLPEGSILLEMSTIGPDAVHELAGALPSGVVLSDSPVLGSVPQAEAGELKIFVGGDEQTFSRVLEVLEVLGSPRLVGPLGAGAGLKLVVNSTLGAVMVAVGEALALGRGLGLDDNVVIDTLSGTYVGGVVKSKRWVIDGESGETHFSLSLAAKDLRLVAQAAERVGLRLRAAEADRLTFEEADETGLADADYGAVITFLRDRAS